MELPPLKELKFKNLDEVITALRDNNGREVYIKDDHYSLYYFGKISFTENEGVCYEFKTPNNGVHQLYYHDLMSMLVPINTPSSKHSLGEIL